VTAGDPEQERSTGTGGSTAGRGTPVPVDIAGIAGTRSTIALLLAGPVIWSGHFMLVYLVAEAGCTGDGPGLRALDPPVPVALTVWTTVIAAIALLGVAVIALRRWRLHRHDEGDGDGLEPVDRDGALAFVAMVLALLGVVEVVFVGVPALVLGPC
jgi:hypothetical protein